MNGVASYKKGETAYLKGLNVNFILMALLEYLKALLGNFNLVTFVYIINNSF